MTAVRWGSSGRGAWRLVVAHKAVNSNAIQATTMPATTPYATHRHTGALLASHTDGARPSAMTTLAIRASQLLAAPSASDSVTTTSSTTAALKAVTVRPVAHGVGSASLR